MHAKAASTAPHAHAARKATAAAFPFKRKLSPVV
jgi:hypothetical protein